MNWRMKVKAFRWHHCWKCKLTILLGISCISMLTMQFMMTHDQDPVFSMDKQGKRTDWVLDTSSGVSFVQLPRVSQKYISPDTTPGQGDSTIFSFSVDQAVNFTLNVSAYYEPMNLPFLFPIQDSSAWFLDNGTWLVACIEDRLNPTDERDIILGIGENAKDLKWKTVGAANITNGMSIAVHGDTITIVYLEKGSTGMGDPDDWPVERVRYFISEDFGNSWVNGTLWDASGWTQAWFSGITLEVYQGNFSCAWGFANASESMKREQSTIWESRHSGSAGEPWTTPTNLTCLGYQSVHAYRPKFLQDHVSGMLYLQVNNVSSPNNYYGILYELGNGINGTTWTDAWELTLEAENMEEPIVDCALDDATGIFYFVNNTTWEDGIRNASGWKAPVGDIDPCELHALNDRFTLLAHQGPKMHCSSILTVSGAISGGLLDCEPGFNFRNINGTLEPYQTYSVSFDGKDAFGNSHNASAYLFRVDTISDTMGSTESMIVVEVDDTIASCNVETSGQYISPSASPGIKDVMQFSMNASKHGIASLFIESNESVIAEINVTDGSDTYGLLATCGDGRTNYLFHGITEGVTNNGVRFTRSSDGGLSWSNGELIYETVERIESIIATSSGDEIYCFVKDEVNYMLFHSLDSGDSFMKSSLPGRIDAFTSDAVAWRSSSNSSHFSINISKDHGYVWKSFLSIPKAPLMAGYSILEGAAFDPTSGNYSFLLVNDSSLDTAFLTVTNDGSVFTISENISTGGSYFLESHGGTMELDWWINSTGQGEWIITSSHYSVINMENLEAALACTTTTGDGTFTPWRNFTSITQGFLPSTFIFWDIHFPVNATPCFANLHFDPILLKGTQITVHAASPLVFSKSIPVSPSSMNHINFAGASGNGLMLADGTYHWWVRFTDRVGHVSITEGNFTIDNMAPVDISDEMYTSPVLPCPSMPTNITVSVVESHPGGAILSYRTNPGNPWTEVSMVMLAMLGDTVNYSVVLPALNTTTVYWQAMIIDAAGNGIPVDDNGQPYSYREPAISVEEQTDPPDELDLSESGSFTVTLIITADEEFVDNITIAYRFDDGNGWNYAILDRITGSVHAYTFQDFSPSITLLEYYITVHDIFGNDKPTGIQQSVQVIPSLPEWNITEDQQVTILFAALAIGLVSGLVFSLIVKRSDPLVVKRGKGGTHEQRRAGTSHDAGHQAGAASIPEPQKVLARDDDSHITQGFQGKSFKNMNIAITITGSIMLITILLAMISIAIFSFPEGSMLALAGTFLCAVVLWMLLAIRAIMKTFHDDKRKLASRPLIFITGLSIFIILVSILLIGNEVPWWRVRVNQEAYDFGDIMLPGMITSLASTFFSSILLLTWSISRNVERVQEELHRARKHNMNPGWLLRKRHAELSILMNSVGLKALVFTVIIGSTIIFASDLSTYTIQGLTLIVPFIIGTASMILAGMLYRRKKIKETFPIVLDHLITCHECGQRTAMGGTYCESCGTKLIKGTRKEQGIRCTNCKSVDPVDARNCRYCGAMLSGNEDSKNSK
ncbi:hypothetical protein GF325_14465, partial [Candidatus Bathyarchaeota archaeon]|nr:hypothetical protein [Candidatus Bathyarchaeota archaeon]